MGGNENSRNLNHFASRQDEESSKCLCLGLHWAGLSTLVSLIPLGMPRGLS